MDNSILVFLEAGLPQELTGWQQNQPVVMFFSGRVLPDLPEYPETVPNRTDVCTVALSILSHIGFYALLFE